MNLINTGVHQDLVTHLVDQDILINLAAGQFSLELESSALKTAVVERHPVPISRRRPRVIVGGADI